MMAPRRLPDLLRRSSIPLLTLTVPLGFAWWAFPSGLAPLRAAGIVAGWLGGGLLMVSLLLMLREPRLAHWLGGLERMYRWHHTTGVLAYVLLLIHPLALAANGLATSPSFAWQTLSAFDGGWPVWTGWLGLLLLMIGLATSFSRKLSYGLWRWLHAGLAIGVLLGLIHLVLLGIDEPVLPIIAVMALIVGWRALRGDLGLAARPYLVAEVQPLTEQSVEIALRPLGHPLTVAPGQFLLVAFDRGPNYRGCGEFHPFTVSSVEREDVLRIAVKALGDCTRQMLSMERGVAARIMGGFDSVFAHHGKASQLWVAGGIGVTPFIGLLRAGPLPAPTTLLYLYRSETDAAFLHELEACAAADPNLTLRLQATGDALPDLKRLLPEATLPPGVECYLCGPPGLIKALRAALRARGVATQQIHSETYEFR